MGGFATYDKGSGVPGTVVYADNVDFTGITRTNTITTNGQLLIGATTANAGGNHINVGNITCPDSTITVGYSSPNITLRVPALSTFVQGTFTAGISFGGGTTGITYSAAGQLGEYTRIGNVVYYSFWVILTSKGSSTGVAAVTGLPVVSGGSPGPIGVLELNRITFDTGSGYFYVTTKINPGITIANIFESGSGTLAPNNLLDTNFANNSQLRGSGFYFTS